MTSFLPLFGMRVVSLATNVPGPVAAARLRSLGATVVKIEPPAGDFLAQVAPAWYAQLCEEQEVMMLDLKSPTGRATLDQRLADADALILSSRPSALARLGLSRDRLAMRFPRLCTISIVGHAFPHGDQPGHDLTYQAEAGLLTDALPRTLFSDLAAGAEAVSELLALLLARTSSGRGGWGEVALASCARALAVPLRHGLTAPGGALGGGNPGYAVYATSDGLVAVGALEPHFLQRLLGLLQLDAADAGAMARTFRARPTRAWVDAGRVHDIPMVAISDA
jgi:crotonobetainyl-CoA:carnitine CoA-transferase CaiB-like acyl-CoA transferase